MPQKPYTSDMSLPLEERQKAFATWLAEEKREEEEKRQAREAATARWVKEEQDREVLALRKLIVEHSLFGSPYSPDNLLAEPTLDEWRKGYRLLLKREEERR